MPESAFKEEQKKDEERKEEEHKRKKQEKQEERSPELESKKGEIEKGADKGMAFGEARVLTEVKYTKVHIKGTLASEKYEPVVKEELAVRLIEEEHKKEERKMEEVRKEESAKEKETTERTMAEKETQAEVTKTKAAAPAPELKRVAVTREETIRREIVQKDREQLAKLIDEARRKGMKEPTKEVASKLFQHYTSRGIKPTVALGRVLMTMKRLGILTKKDTKGVTDFLKSLFSK
jgi:hypothetical protein